jgi:hypothetical protein
MVLSDREDFSTDMVAGSERAWIATNFIVAFRIAQRRSAARRSSKILAPELCKPSQNTEKRVVSRR